MFWPICQVLGYVREEKRDSDFNLIDTWLLIYNTLSINSATQLNSLLKNVKHRLFTYFNNTYMFIEAFLISFNMRLEARYPEVGTVWDSQNVEPPLCHYQRTPLGPCPCGETDVTKSIYI